MSEKKTTDNHIEAYKSLLLMYHRQITDLRGNRIKNKLKLMSKIRDEHGNFGTFACVLCRSVNDNCNLCLAQDKSQPSTMGVGCIHGGMRESANKMDDVLKNPYASKEEFIEALELRLIAHVKMIVLNGHAKILPIKVRKLFNKI